MGREILMISRPMAFENTLSRSLQAELAVKVIPVRTSGFCYKEF